MIRCIFAGRKRLPHAWGDRRARRPPLMQTPIAAVSVAEVVPDDADVIPEGFELMPAFGPFHEMVSPTWYRKSERGQVVGMRVREQHRNLGQMMHGGPDGLIEGAARFAVCPGGRAPYTATPRA